MALAVTSCAPCVFDVVSTTLLSAPFVLVGTVVKSVIPVVTTGLNGSSFTSLSTTFITEEVPSGAPTGLPVGSPLASSTLDFSVASDLTWSTLGTLLTFPTIYVEYLAFQGAAATATTICAQSLAPTPLSLNAPPASLIYPENNNTSALPAGLLTFLGNAGFEQQLAGKPLEICASAGAAAPASSLSSNTAPTTATNSSAPNSSASSTVAPLAPQSGQKSTITSTSVSTSSTPPRHNTTSIVPGALPSSVITLQPVRSVATVTGNPIIINSGFTTTVPLTPQAVNAASSSTTEPPSINPLLSALASLAANRATSTSSSSLEALTIITAYFTNGTVSGQSTVAVETVTALPPNATAVASASATYTAFFTANGAQQGARAQSALGLLGGIVGLLALL